MPRSTHQDREAGTRTGPATPPGSEEQPGADGSPGPGEPPGPRQQPAAREPAGSPAPPGSQEPTGSQEPPGFTAEGARRETAAGFARWVAELAAGRRPFPLPGAGRTAERFAALTAAAEEDVCVARLVEGHVDALAILAELGGPVPEPDSRWGVWAAEPPGEGLTAAREGDGWVLSGLKRYCSGAHSCTHALVTAAADDGRRLFAVRTGPAAAQAVHEAAGAADRGGPAGSCVPVPGSWQALGMAGSDTPDVRFHDVPGVPVGPVAAYVSRPGFAHGGIGVAACWYGGARAVARPLLRAAAKRGPDPLTDAHLGEVDMRLHAAGALLRRAADEIDADPLDAAGTARVRGLRVRAFVESVCAAVLTHVGRATGAGPLCHDPRHARAVADLTVYVRQHHAERSLAELGGLVARGESS